MIASAYTYGSAMAFNATNPLAPVLLVGALSPIIGQSALSPGGAAALLFGMFRRTWTKADGSGWRGGRIKLAPR